MFRDGSQMQEHSAGLGRIVSLRGTGGTVHHAFLWHSGGTKIKENKNALTVFNHKGLISLERETGFEPATFSLGSCIIL